MRDLKFRIWDDKIQKNIYFDLVNSFGHIPNDLKNKVQQYTGIQDSKGEYIYEGDNLKITGSRKDGEGSVVYIKGSYYVFFSDEGSSENGTFQYLDSYNPEHIEIKGNIFEHEKPEI